MTTPTIAGFARRSDAVMNLGHFLTQTAHRLPDHPAIMSGDDVITYGALNARADALAHALKAAGIGKGDRVLIHSANHPDMVVAIYAIWKAGAVIVPTNFRLGPDDIVKMREASGASAVIANAAFPEHFEALADGGILRERMFVIGGSFDEAVEAHRADGAFREAEVERDDPAWYFFTSGTTGFPKTAVLTHGQMAFVLVNHAADLMPGLSHRDRSLVIAPLSHGAGLHLFVQVAKGATSVLMPGDGFDPAEAWRLIAEHRITNMFTVPTIIKRLVEDESARRCDPSSLRHVIYAGAPMYRADQKKALAVMGKCLVQYFGLGEVTGAITVLPADEHDADDAKMRVGSCGHARTGMEIAILSEAGEELGVRETGNVAVRGPAVFSGYLDNDSANAESFSNGWFVTGDVGHMDEGGYLYLTGRRSDMYISGGSNVYPRETEEILLTHEAIAEVAIVGVPDEKWGEVGAAMIVLKDGATLTDDDLVGWMEGRVAKYKRPAHVFFVPSLPKSGYGKVEKKTVRAMLLEGGLSHLKAMT